MPFYEYRATSEENCSHCGAGFTRLQKLSEAPLDACPGCGSPIQRVISAPQVVSGKAHMNQQKNIEKHGFTQYRKIGGGYYEKTAGSGPRIIKGD